VEACSASVISTTCILQHAVVCWVTAITLGLGNIIYRRSMHRDSCHLLFFLATCDLEVRPEPPTAQLATTEAVEGARKLRVGGGGVPTPKRVRRSPELEGWSGRCQTAEGGAWSSAGRRGARQRTGYGRVGQWFGRRWLRGNHEKSGGRQRWRRRGDVSLLSPKLMLSRMSPRHPFKSILVNMHIGTSGQCPLCNLEPEDVMHMLPTCPRVVEKAGSRRHCSEYNAN
jgi:hypothetical protein